MSKTPRLRTANKSVPLYNLNEFPVDFPFNVGEQLVYILATRGATDIEGKEWEQMFAKAIKADWKFSSIGLDDIVHGHNAWGAKSVKHKKPQSQKQVRLISGRNDIQYSYDYVPIVGKEPDKVGEDVLNIWNDRVSDIKKHYKFMRTVILIRSYDITEALIFEFETILYQPELYYWKWNKNKNLEGYSKRDNKHKFTWQSGGCQFTIIEEVPNEYTFIKVKTPELIPKDFILKEIKFDKSWVTVTKHV